MSPAADKIDRWGFPIPPDVLAKAEKAAARAAKRNAPPPRPKLGPGSAKYQRELEGLRLLEGLARQRPGLCFTDQQIADACRTTSTHVNNLTRNGLRKMRNRLPPDALQTLRDLGRRSSAAALRLAAAR